MLGHTSHAGYVSGINERRVLEALLGGMINPGQVVYNIEDYVRYSAFWFARNAASAGGAVPIVAFEPEPEYFALLSKNVYLNPGLNVSCEKLAIGDLDGVVRMSPDGRADGAADDSDDVDFLKSTV